MPFLVVRRVSQQVFDRRELRRVYKCISYKSSHKSDGSRLSYRRVHHRHRPRLTMLTIGKDFVHCVVGSMCLSEVSLVTSDHVVDLELRGVLLVHILIEASPALPQRSVGLPRLRFRSHRHV